MRNATAVELKNVIKKFGDVIAVNDVSLSIERGEYFVLIGPSGCGKTTLLKIIAGLERPDGGQVYIDGKSMEGVPAYKRGVSMVFQNFALFPHRSVAENIGFGLEARNYSGDQIDKEVKEMMKLVGLEGLEKRFPHELSGGQQQRVGLARALVVKPKVLLLDEPLGNIDYKLQKKMELELKTIHEKVGTTFIHVTHNQEQAMALADRIAIMNRGVIEQEGRPDEIYSKPETAFAARFVGEINMLQGRIVSLEEDVVHVSTTIGDFTAPARTGLKIGQKVIYAIRPEHVSLEDGPSLQENSAKGELDRVIYKGGISEVLVKLSDGSILRLQTQGPSPHVTRGPLRVGWKTRDALILEKASKVELLDLEKVLLGL